MKNKNLATIVMWIAFTAVAMTSVHAQTPLPSADQANIGPKSQIEAVEIPVIPPCDSKLPCVKTTATFDFSDVHKCRPEYPLQSLNAGEVGLVVMQFLIDADGTVLDSKIESSSRYPRLDAAALKIAKCKYRPGTENGLPIKSWGRFEYAFKMDDGPQTGLEFSEPQTSLLYTFRRPFPWSAVPTQVSVPIDKQYSELTAEEREVVRAMYGSMNADDEPPFPEAGMKSLYEPISRAQAKLNQNGLLRLYVEVSAEGIATAVRGSTAVSRELTDFASKVAMLIKYKHAIRNGKPAAMDFYLYLYFGEANN